MFRMTQLKFSQEFCHITFNTSLNVSAFRLLELLSYDILVELYITVGDSAHNLLSHLRNLLALLTLETVPSATHAQTPSKAASASHRLRDALHSPPSRNSAMNPEYESRP